MMLKSVGPLIEPVRTQDSQSLEGCVLAPRKKEITSSDQPQRPGKMYSIELHRRIGISFDERSALWSLFVKKTNKTGVIGRAELIKIMMG